MGDAAVDRLVLASASPRRRELLAATGRHAEVIVADVDESVRPGEPPHDYVERLARTKAETVAGRMAPPSAGLAVIGADTAVVIDGEILGKPSSTDDAGATLARLSGRWHEVLTGVAVVRRGPDDAGAAAATASAVAVTRVRFRTLDPTEIDAYVATGDPLDKAGSYGIQGGAGGFVAELEGDADTVIGLPTRLLADLLDT